MNVFILDKNPIRAARAQCNKHVVKMVVESAQLLVTAFPKGTTRYKITHFNHPSAKWIRESLFNYEWMIAHARELCNEYTRRYGKVHKSEEIIMSLGTPDLPELGLTPFPRVIKEPWKAQSMHMSVVDAYRHYYLNDKVRFAKWAPRAKPPTWWPNKRA